MNGVVRAMTKWDIVKKILFSIITLLSLTALLLYIFRNNLGYISAAFNLLSVLDILWLFVLGASYQLLDGLACCTLVRMTVSAFSYRQALEVIYLGVFGKVSTFGAGTIPMQAYYLYRCGVEIGHGVGIMTFSYALHKVSIILFVSVLLLFQRKWFHEAIPHLRIYLIAGYLICLTIISILLLICTWKRAHNCATWLLGKLPDKGKWLKVKHKLQEQLDCLFCETSAFLNNRLMIMRVMVSHTLKLSILCAVPYFCMRMLGASTLSLVQVELMTGLALLIAGAVPNVAGMGPTEALFFLIFMPILGADSTTSSLLLFRISSYYFPFLVSVVAFVIVQAKLLSSSKSKGRSERKKPHH